MMNPNPADEAGRLLRDILGQLKQDQDMIKQLITEVEQMEALGGQR
jgi:hypothetical protein